MINGENDPMINDNVGIYKLDTLTIMSDRNTLEIVLLKMNLKKLKKFWKQNFRLRI